MCPVLSQDLPARRYSSDLFEHPFLDISRPKAIYEKAGFKVIEAPMGI